MASAYVKKTSSYYLPAYGIIVVNNHARKA